MNGDSARARVNRVAEVYEWMQEDNRFPHPDEYHPYELAKKNNKGLLKSSDPREFPQLGLDDVRRKIHEIKHIGERAVTVFGLKTGVRPGELANLRVEDVHITNVDVLNHFDGKGQDHGQMGSHSQLDGRQNAVFIDTKKNRPGNSKQNKPGNKRKNPTVLPLDSEMRRVLIDWLLIRPDNGSPWVFLTQKGGQMKPSNLQYVWRKHWWPEYEVTDDEKRRSISPHYARHWFSTWFRTQARMPEPWVQYLRGDVQSSEVDNSRDAFHRYIHTYYEDVEDEYRENVFTLGI
jgi:integrase/recombinase XerD